VSITEISRPIQLVDVVGQYRRYQEEIDEAVLRVLRSGAFINGPEVKAFEREMEEFLGVRHAIACASGTDALQLSLMALDLKPGDEVITTPFTFAATTETIVLLGGTPVYVDIDPTTFNIDPSLIEEKITPRTRAILPVHLFGQSCDITRIIEIGQRHHIAVIEDAAQAVGARWDGQRVCGFGDLASISFYPSKNLGAFGDGGMVATNDDVLALAVRSIANHGSSRPYYHDRLGVCSRLDSIQAAILRVKLKYLDEWNETRRDAARWYGNVLEAYEEVLQLPSSSSRVEHIWHQYSIVIRDPKLDRDGVVANLRSAGVPSSVFYPVPLHKQPAYAQSRQSLPNAEYAADHVFSVPMHSELTEGDVSFISEKIIEAIKA
jgi:UDP-2-acetamido-2-deoxy-ribo-hexuluronate aminotransferase